MSVLVILLLFNSVNLEFCKVVPIDLDTKSLKLKINKKNYFFFQTLSQYGGVRPLRPYRFPRQQGSRGPQSQFLPRGQRVPHQHS